MSRCMPRNGTEAVPYAFREDFPVGNAVPGVPQYSLAKPSHLGEIGPAADYNVIARPKAVAISTAAVGCADGDINIENPGYTMLIGAVNVETWCWRLPRP